MSQGQRSEAFGEGDLPRVIEALVTQENRLVVEQGPADRGDVLIAQRATCVEAGDLRPDVAGEPGHGDESG